MLVFYFLLRMSESENSSRTWEHECSQNSFIFHEYRNEKDTEMKKGKTKTWSKVFWSQKITIRWIRAKYSYWTFSHLPINIILKNKKWRIMETNLATPWPHSQLKYGSFLLSHPCFSLFFIPFHSPPLIFSSEWLLLPHYE